MQNRGNYAEIPLAWRKQKKYKKSQDVNKLHILVRHLWREADAYLNESGI